MNKISCKEDINKKNYSRRRLLVLALFDETFRRVITYVCCSFFFGLFLFSTIIDNNERTNIKMMDSQSEKELRNCGPNGCQIFSKDLKDPKIQSILDSAVECSIHEYKDNEDEEKWRNYISRNYATLTLMSNRESKVNQDRGFIIYPLKVKHNLENENHKDDFMIGIFDGHANLGHLVAQKAVNEVEGRFIQKMETNFHENDDEFIKKVLKDVMKEIDESIPHHISMDGGCTASIVLRWGYKLYFSNVGDSQSFVATTTSNVLTKINYMTRLDKPNLPEERQRIESMKGRIHIPPQNPSWARVIVYSSILNEDVGLAMSRSLGDLEWTAVGVIPEPTIEVVNLKDVISNATTGEQIFVVSASDGLYDTLRPKFIANYIGSTFQQQCYPLLACEELIQLASPRNPTFYRDDITISVIKLIL